MVIWILRPFYDSIPRDLEESAHGDGATPRQAYTRIILPLLAAAPKCPYPTDDWWDLHPKNCPLPSRCGIIDLSAKTLVINYLLDIIINGTPRVPEICMRCRRPHDVREPVLLRSTLRRADFSALFN